MQNKRDLILMESIKNRLNCGSIKIKNNDTVHFVVYKYADICDKIIPLFSENPLLGNKAKDLNDFKAVMNLMKNKAHLTESGIDEIIKIKNNMNRGRIDQDNV